MPTTDNKSKIVDTALQMFNNRGIRGVTMDDIASAMHISKRTLYETFANKEELLSECMKRLHSSIVERHNVFYTKTDEPVLMALYLIRVNAGSNHRYKHIKEELNRYYPEIHKQFFEMYADSFRQALIESLEYAEKHDYLRKGVDIKNVANFIVDYVQLHHISDHTDSGKYAEMMSEIGFTFLRGLMSVDTIRRYESREEEFHKILNDIDKT